MVAKEIGENDADYTSIDDFFYKKPVYNEKSN